MMNLAGKHILVTGASSGMGRFFSRMIAAEGATVSYESSFGEGRLNDSYVLQMLRQAKIEDQFPSYSDVKGAADSYPANAFYYFNGAFAQFLQQNYGMDKYAEFWFRCVNAKYFTAAGAFKQAFGMKLNKAWKLFEESFEYFEEAGFRIKYKTFDLHAESPYENFVTEHENMFTEEGKKIKFLIAEPIREV